MWEDFWEHAAVIREWSKHLWSPGNPHLAIDIGSPRYMPFFFFITLLSRTFTLGPIQALGIGGVISILLLLYSIWFFMMTYFRNNWAPVIGLIVLLTGWGVGWTWSNIYQLRSLFVTITYPSTFVFGLALLSFALVVKVLRGELVSKWWYLAVVFLTGLMFLSHPLTGAFAIASIYLLALLEPHVRPGRRVSVIIAVFGGILLCEIWPFFSVWRDIVNIGSVAHTLSNTDTMDLVVDKYVLSHPFYDPFEVFATFGPAWFGIPCLIVLFLKGRHRFITIGFLVFILSYFANLFVPLPGGRRCLLYSIFYLHLGLIWAFLEILTQPHNTINSTALFWSHRLIKRAIICFLGFCVLLNVTLTFLEFTGHHNFGHRELQQIVGNMEKISEFLQDESIVLASPSVGWPLAAFSAKVVSLPTGHYNPMVKDCTQRERLAIKFFRDSTAQTERIEILHRLKASHILYRETYVKDSVKEGIESLGKSIKVVRDYVLIEVKKNI